MKSLRGLALLLLVSVLFIARGQEFEGVEVNIVTFTGPQIAEPLQRRAPEFEQMTGAEINVITVPFSDLYQRMLTDMATGTNSFDAFVFAPQWMVDFVVPGFLEDLTERVGNDEELRWDDVAQFFREFSATYQGHVYTIPLDGDFLMVYYRRDLLEQEGMDPPNTWDDYLAIAEAFDGQDLNGDGEADYGSCITKKRNAQAYHMTWGVAGSYLQTQGTAQGAFFDQQTMEPLVDNEAFAEVLEFFDATTEFGPPNVLNLDVGGTRSLFITGRCALSMDWGDIGALAIDPEQSVVQEKVGAVILPGTSEVLDRETGELVECNPEICPHADEEGVNHAPYAAFGGWSGAINAAVEEEVKEAAYAFLAYMSQPEQANVDVTRGVTGFNPYRLSQFENLDLWMEGGFSEQWAGDYLGAIESSLQSPNMVLDLRVPQNQRYQQVILDRALSQFLAGELSKEQAMTQIYQGWEEITEELGRDQQRQAYLDSLGIER